MNDWEMALIQQGLLAGWLALTGLMSVAIFNWPVVFLETTVHPLTKKMVQAALPAYRVSCKG